tara:strand:+ start:977 stop:1132 length:156 start_codon:yes stop_codon:yes gene_type:complete
MKFLIIYRDFKINFDFEIIEEYKNITEAWSDARDTARLEGLLVHSITKTNL